MVESLSRDNFLQSDWSADHRSVINYSGQIDELKMLSAGDIVEPLRLLLKKVNQVKIREWRQGMKIVKVWSTNT